MQTENAYSKVSVTRMTLIRSKIPTICSGRKEDLEDDDDNEEESWSFPDNTCTASSSSSYQENAHSTSYPSQQEIPALTDEIEYEESNSITATNTSEVRKSTTRMTSST